MKTQVLWGITFCGLVNICRRFLRAYRFHRQRLTLQELSEDVPACDPFPTASSPVEESAAVYPSTQLETAQETIIAVVRSDKYVGYSESKYRLRISLAHPPECHFAHV